MSRTKIFKNKVVALELDEWQTLIVTPFYYDKNFELASIYLMILLEQKRELKYQFFLEWIELMSNEHKQAFTKILEHFDVIKEIENEG